MTFQEKYQELQSIRQRLKKVGKRYSPVNYWKLKNRETELTKELNHEATINPCDFKYLDSRMLKRDTQTEV